MPAIAAAKTSNDFYISKDVTQQNEFIKKYPKYDGRGLVIAILDTSVDVSVAGLQKTSTGISKIIDCYDFTGNGHVDTSTVREMDKNNILIGLSGCELKIPSKWKNPSGQWHLGLKSLYELCPDIAIKNIIKERTAAIRKENEAIKQKFAKEFKKKGEANYEALKEYLHSAEQLSNDSLVADCIVWFNGNQWLACIDASLTGNLKKKKVLKNFSEGQEYGTLLGQVTYCIKILDNGNLLEIYTPFDNHGTGIAHMAAGHFPGESKKDGLAPGAQIIPMTVYDIRDGNLLCKYALKNALLKCIELKVDIVNCSVTTFYQDNEELINQMTEEHGMIITKSAANYGPVYASLCKYDPLYKNIFVVSAVHGNSKDLVVPYYSSYGPASDASRGINFVVPADATTIVPRFNYPVKVKSSSGTSNAAPYAAGAIACLISALKANSIEYSPAILKVAISKTAFLPKSGDRLAFGYGIIQICAAFEFLKTCKNSLIQQFLKCENQIKFENEDKNGIILRLGGKYDETDEESIEISKSLDETNKNVKLELITSETAKKFISTIKDNTITIKIDTNLLQPGSVSYAEIHGSNPLTPLFNPIFHFPLMIILPTKVTQEDNYCINRNVTLNPNTPNRIFLLPPKSCYQCFVKLTSSEKISERIYFQWSIENEFTNFGKWITFDGKNTTQTCQIPICWGRVYEFSFISYNCAKSLNLNVEYSFYGIYVTRPLSISTKVDENNAEKSKIIKNQNIIEFSNYFENLTASLSLEFKQISYKINPINTCYEMIKNVYNACQSNYLKLTYAFKVSEKSKYAFEINLEKNFKLHTIQFFTESKKFVHSCNSYKSNKEVTLMAGTYLIVAYVYNNTESKTDALPAESLLPSITVTMDLLKSLKPTLYYPSEKSSKDIKDELIEFKYQVYKTKMDPISTEDLPNLLPPNTILHGILYFKKENTNLEVSISHEYFLNLNNDEKNNSKSFSCNLVEKLFNSLSINKDLSIQNENIADMNIVKSVLPVSQKSNKSIIKTLKKKKRNNRFIYPINDPLLLIHLDTPGNNTFKHAETDMSKSEISELRKDIAQIKQAISAGQFGKALLNLNKLSTKNQTNPAFKFIDKTIIEILKHLKWDYLVKTHQYALLDRHRDSSFILKI